MSNQPSGKRRQVIINDNCVPASQLLAGARELIIRHKEEFYRLRITANDKLILTK